MDFSTVPTATFRVLSVFSVIHHAGRSVLHVRVAEHPTASWITQQLREAFPYIVVNERHLQRLLSDLVAYCHDDRTHLGLAKGTPSGRTATAKPIGNSEVVAIPRIGGLHHRYECCQAA